MWNEIVIIRNGLVLKSLHDFIYGISGEVYVLSVKSFAERHRLLEQEFAKNNVEFNYIFEHDIENMAPEKYGARFCDGGALSKAHKSLVLKHIAAWDKLLKSNSEMAFVFEDDIAFIEGFEKYALDYEKEIKDLPPGVMVYLGGSDAKVPISVFFEKKLLFRQPITTAEGYIIDKKVAKRRLAWIRENAIDLPADHLMVKMDGDLRIPHYWMLHPMVLQRSVTGELPSCLDGSRNKHSGIYNLFRYNWMRFKRRLLPMMISKMVIK